jgi:hypothetical protein
MPDLAIEVYRDGWTDDLQVALMADGSGYRLAGPKFNGSGSVVLSYALTQRDADEIRRMLDRAFPRGH